MRNSRRWIVAATAGAALALTLLVVGGIAIADTDNTGVNQVTYYNENNATYSVVTISGTLTSSTFPNEQEGSAGFNPPVDAFGPDGCTATVPPAPIPTLTGSAGNYTEAWTSPPAGAVTEGEANGGYWTIELQDMSGTLLDSFQVDQPYTAAEGGSATAGTTASGSVNYTGGSTPGRLVVLWDANDMGSSNKDVLFYHVNSNLLFIAKC